jgi:hypothetical protein
VLTRFTELDHILSANLAAVEAIKRLLEALVIDINTKKSKLPTFI